MADFTNDFSWSWSRHRTMQVCRRQYYFAHYGFWGGWRRDASPEARQLYTEKKLTTRAMWVGTTVHAVAEDVLAEVRRGHYPEPDAVVSRVQDFANQAIQDSRAGRYGVNPKRYPGFACHYFDEPEDLDGVVEEVTSLSAGLFDNPVFQRLSAVPERIVEVERLEKLVIGDVPVWVSLDVLVRDGQGGFVIIDWKTGAHHDTDQVRRQLGIYTLYVLDRYAGGGTADTPIQAMMVNLRSGERDAHMCGPEHIQGATQLVRDSAAQMRSLLRDVPSNRAHKDDFEALPEGAEACGRCVFRVSCGRG